MLVRKPRIARDSYMHVLYPFTQYIAHTLNRIVDIEGFFPPIQSKLSRSRIQDTACVDTQLIRLNRKLDNPHSVVKEIKRNEAAHDWAKNIFKPMLKNAFNNIDIVGVGSTQLLNHQYSDWTLLKPDCDHLEARNGHDLTVLDGIIHNLNVRRRNLLDFCETAYNYANDETDREFKKQLITFKKLYSDKHVILIDDSFASGATKSIVIHALYSELKMDLSKVHFLSLVRE